MTSAFLNPLLIDKSVRRALDEDLGRAGDITTLATIPATATAVAVISARKPGVLAGMPLAEAAFRVFDPECAVRAIACRRRRARARRHRRAHQRPSAIHPVERACCAELPGTPVRYRDAHIALRRARGPFRGADRLGAEDEPAIGP